MSKLKIEGTLLYLLIINIEELVRDVKVADSLGYSNREMVQFMIMKKVSKLNSRFSALSFEMLLK